MSTTKIAFHKLQNKLKFKKTYQMDMMELSLFNSIFFFFNIQFIRYLNPLSLFFLAT